MWRRRRVLVILLTLASVLVWFLLTRLADNHLLLAEDRKPVNIDLPHTERLREVDLDREHGSACQSVLDFTIDIYAGRDQSFFSWPPKRPKSFQPYWRPSKRQGRRSVVTTLFSVHLKEAIPVLENQPPPDEALDDLFRCRGFGERRRMDARLVETVIEVARHFQSPRIEVVSGYRSPKFNDSLAKKGRHVAQESKHTKGLALDFRVKTAPAAEVASWLWKNFEGGIGTYVKDNFIHIDMGGKRRWRGR